MKRFFTGDSAFFPSPLTSLPVPFDVGPTPEVDPVLGIELRVESACDEFFAD